jgi:vacuole morphology and inheritance protein 14
MSKQSFDPDKVLGESVTRLLSDKLYEKRKCGASEIQQMVQRASQRSESAHVQRIIKCLTIHYIESEEPSLRKGGLIGLSGVAMGWVGKCLP